jgi:hypothetical protein
MRAHKFLAPGALGPFSGFAWPGPDASRPGAWVEWDGPLVPCASGVHALRVGVLPAWLDDELWSVELEGPVVEDDGVLVAGRGRLVERVEAWDAAAAREFARGCVERARAYAAPPAPPRAAECAGDAASYADAVRRPRDAAVVGYVAAHAAEAAGEGGLVRERAAQARWLADRLELFVD